MPDTSSPPAGFESHWDARWFSEKSAECRRIAAMLSDHAQRQNLLALAEDFQNQSEHAALLAQIALGKLMRAQSPG